MTDDERFWLDVLGVLEFVSRGATHAATRPFPDIQARRALGNLHDHPELALGGTRASSAAAYDRPMRCRHCSEPIVFVHAQSGDVFCHDRRNDAESDTEMLLRQRLAIAEGRIRQFERRAERLVEKAKAWTRVNSSLSSPDERQRAVDELAEAIDDLDPTLSERVEPDRVQVIAASLTRAAFEAARRHLRDGDWVFVNEEAALQGVVPWRATDIWVDHEPPGA